MAQFALRATLLTSLLVLCAPSATSQSSFPEVEPNGPKAEATPVVCMRAGDTLTGTSTGGGIAPGSSAATSADTFRVQTCALPLCIYRHRLVITTAGTAGHAGTIRGLSQTGGVINPGTDIVMQTSAAATTPPRHNEWYGFGKAEEIYYRVAGAAATTSPYTVTMETVPVAPVAVAGTFNAGTITITTEGQGHTTDTEMWVYDSSLNAIPFFGNDDTPTGLPGSGTNFESTLQETFTPGTYFVAISIYQLGNNLPAAPNDFQTGSVVDFPNSIVTGPVAVTVPLNVSFQVSDGATTTPVAATRTERYEILWFQFTVVAPTSPTPYCFGDSGNCPCGNIGAAGNGCPSSVNAAGGNLAGAGNPSVSSDSLVLSGSGMPNSSALYFQGTTRLAGGSGVVFGDGLRCVAGQIIRLGTKQNVANSSQYPATGDLPVSQKGLVGMGGCIRMYQCWYRNADASFCTPSTFNLTNAVEVTWIP